MITCCITCRFPQFVGSLSIMPKIPHTIRRDGRYYFRRRARWENGNQVHVVIPLSTCIASDARWRATMLAAHFDKVKRAVGAHFEAERPLEPGLLKGLFEAELRHCLAGLIQQFYDPANDPAALVARFRTHASAFDLAQRPGVINELTPAHRELLAKAGHDEHDIEFVACDLDRYCGKFTIADGEMALMAEGLDHEPSPAVIGRLKHIHLQAQAEAHRLASLFLDEDVQCSFDQEGSLLKKRRADGTPLTFVEKKMAAPAPPAVLNEPSDEQSRGSPPQPQCAFLKYHAERFSEKIPKILELARLAGHWNRNLAQYERVLKTFAWITGDKPLGDYEHSDVARYKNALLRMPKEFRPTKDFGRPYAEVEKTFKGTMRSMNTVKRDLSYMSTAYEILAEDEWQPRMPNTKVLDFSGVRLGKHKKVSPKTKRPPWTPQHMHCLFSAPLWTGGGGKLKRFNRNAGDEVYQDAAYWLPLLLFYTHAAVSEIAGLRADEVRIDDVVPNLVIKDNDVRAEDGVDGGEKTTARGRLVPLHEELLRLGLANYVQAIRAEGHKALFPELYLNEARIGGHQFRNVAWRHMQGWISAHMSIPTNPVSGKTADMYSIRSLGSSFYAKEDAPDLMRADIMGHARTGTNALHYSQRLETHGADTVLAEYRAYMAGHIDVVTQQVPRRKVVLLPLNHRSRTGRPVI